MSLPSGSIVSFPFQNNKNAAFKALSDELKMSQVKSKYKKKKCFRMKATQRHIYNAKVQC